MVARQARRVSRGGDPDWPRISSARLVLGLGCEPERMMLAPFATVGILRAPTGGHAVCLVTMDAPVSELGDRLAMLMGDGAPAVLAFLADRFPKAAPGQTSIWARLSASLPRSVGLAAGFVRVDADFSGPDWQAAKAASMSALAHDLLDAAQGFWREASYAGLWLPPADPVEALSARPH